MRPAGVSPFGEAGHHGNGRWRFGRQPLSANGLDRCDEVIVSPVLARRQRLGASGADACRRLRVASVSQRSRQRPPDDPKGQSPHRPRPPPPEDPPRRDGARLRLRVPASRLRHPLGAVHRQARQHGHAGALRGVPHARGHGRGGGRGHLSVHPLGLLSQQQGDGARQDGPDAPRRLRRRGPARARRARQAGRRRAQDRECRRAGRLRRARHRGGHARLPRRQPDRARARRADASGGGDAGCAA